MGQKEWEIREENIYKIEKKQWREHLEKSVRKADMESINGIQFANEANEIYEKQK